jgi:DNA-binding beta-propeller fold protein YncE
MKYTFVIIATVFLIAFACTKDQSAFQYGDYPEEIGRLMLTKCATSGCHDDKSYKAAGNLNLSTWGKLFEGSPSGSVVIAGRADVSSLCYFINYESNGEKLDPSLPSVKPYMPYNGKALTFNEYNAIKNWINDGAVNNKGEKRFNNNNVTQKYYITNQGCDEVCVMDAKSSLPMRYVKVGVSPSPELPHMVRVSPDGKYWYVCFIGNQNATITTPSNIFQKYDAVTDELIATCILTNTNGTPFNNFSTSWNTFAIRPDGKEACVADLSSGILVRVDLEKMTTIEAFLPDQFGSSTNKLHGTVYSSTGKVLYATNQNSNEIIKFYLDTNENGRELITINPSNSNAQPHEIIFRPDAKYYFISCQGSKSNNQYELSVMNTKNDSLIKLIQTGIFPQEMTISKKRNLLFVTCTEDNVNAALGTKGVITVIDMNTLNVIHTITDVGYQPHGIAIDDVNDRIIVASRNANPTGPAPHHASNCGGRNGFVTTFDLNTFQKIKKRIELLPDPYSIAFKPF